MPFFATLQRMSLQTEKGFTWKLFYLQGFGKSGEVLWGGRAHEAWPQLAQLLFLLNLPGDITRSLS